MKLKLKNIKLSDDIPRIELVYQHKGNPTTKPKITDSASAYDLLLKHWDMNKIDLVEDFTVLLMNRANYCIGISKVATGGMTGTVVDPKIIFATALMAASGRIIVAHNHPSGNLTPSAADLHTTKKLYEGGKLLDIDVLDHLIVTSHSYYSFADDRLVFQ